MQSALAISRSTSLLRVAFLFFMLTAACICTGTSFGAPAPLPSDQAFIFSVDSSQPKELFARWQIAPGYYLYKERLKVKLFPESLAASIKYPQGEFKYDPTRGRQEVYSGMLIVPVKLTAPVLSGQLQVEYQGCSSSGFCYPPTHKTITLGAASSDTITPLPAASSSTPSLLNNQNNVQDLFANHGLTVTLLIFAGIGLLLAFTPCVLPMIPILTGIIIGQKGKMSTRRAFLLSGTYVLGSSITYAAAGYAAATMGSSLQSSLQKPFVIVIVSLLFVLLACSLFGLYHLRLPHRVQHHIHRIHHKQEGGTFIGVFIMGIISTLIVSPCVTAPLVGVLLYISQTGDKLLGVSALFAMSIGMGIPLLLIGMSAGRWLPKTGPWMVAVKEMFGMLMLGMAIWLLSRIMPVTVTKVLWSLLIAGALVYIILGLARSRRLHRKWAYTLGVTAGLLSLFLIAGNMADLVNLNPGVHNFIVVRNEQELTRQLALAQEQHKAVLVDFYADWCESCVLMDKNVFYIPHVQQALKNYVLIRADLTANNRDDEQLLKKYAIVAPPTVLFFDKVGQEKNPQRIVGEVTAAEFLTRLNTFETASCSNNKINC